MTKKIKFKAFNSTCGYTGPTLTIVKEEKELFNYQKMSLPA